MPDRLRAAAPKKMLHAGGAVSSGAAVEGDRRCVRAADLEEDEADGALAREAERVIEEAARVPAAALVGVGRDVEDVELVGDVPGEHERQRLRRRAARHPEAGPGASELLAELRLVDAAAVGGGLGRGAERERRALEGEHRLGGGPVLGRGSAIHPLVFDRLVAAADAASIAYTIQANARATYTDADAIYLSRAGVATGVISVPNRYMHSPNEIVSLADLRATARLLAEFVAGLESSASFVAR
jgi:acetylornithine deacetylase/succinyl-diaminopimelate desuccinylase-like protein